MEIVEFILKGNGSDISVDLREPIAIPPDARLGLKNFVTYNNVPNVTRGYNNQLKIKVPGGEYETFGLETGAYELSAIGTQLYEWIQQKHPELKDVEENFKLIPNEATSKCEFLFKVDYGIDFNVEHSLNDLLGFGKTKFHGSGRYIGEKIVNITNVIQFIFCCNIIETNYINAMHVPFIFNSNIDVPPGYRLIRELSKITYKKLNTSQISNIRVWIVDQDGRPVNLRHDTLIITLSLRYDRNYRID